MSKSLLDVALGCVKRGWFVHPLKPQDKYPITPHGKDDATRDTAQIEAWWARTPNANVGIACGPSGLCVLDADHGLNSMEDFIAWRDRNGLPGTYAVHSGRRPEFGVQSYYSGHLKDGKFELDGVSGDIKSAGGLVLAAGCIHPSGEEYRAIVDASIAPLPSVVDKSRVKPVNVAVGDEPITENRNTTLTSIAGRLRTAGLSAAALELALLQVNEDRCAPPLEEEEVKQIAASVGRYALPEPEVEVRVNSPKIQPEVDPLSWFDTADQIMNAEPVDFIVNDIIPKNRYTGFVALSGSRKTIIACNLVRTALTGHPSWGSFRWTMPRTASSCLRRSQPAVSCVSVCRRWSLCPICNQGSCLCGQRQRMEPSTLTCSRRAS